MTRWVRRHIDHLTDALPNVDFDVPNIFAETGKIMMQERKGGPRPRPVIRRREDEEPDTSTSDAHALGLHALSEESPSKKRRTDCEVIDIDTLYD